MNINDFKALLMAFAEEPSDIDVRRGQATFQIRDEVYDVSISYANDEAQSLMVEEFGQKMAARPWLLNRVARMPQLAERLISTLRAGNSPDQPFVIPAGILSPDLATSDGVEKLQIENAVDALLNFGNDKLPGATSVLYLTSDAGEGKTTIINRVALIQAEKYKQRLAATLVVPIPLSGRAFLTFDDAVIAALVNKFRFNYFYFDAFLALVKLGAIVPAFDGYEEMLVEGSKGEAVSALGGLVQSLDSSGSVIIAARKAFFDYLSFKSQAKLLDAIGSHSASFLRLELSRWDKNQFITYGNQRGIHDPENIYSIVSNRLKPDHPLLTRAVLVRRLYDVAESDVDRAQLLEMLGANPQDYFFTFVDAIVKREATEKWLARVSGDVMEPLLTVAEHHELLAQIAVEMWQSSARHLKFDVLDVLVDIFAEGRKKSGMTTRQIRERIKQHSLLATDPVKSLLITFDHEDFQDFYLGEGVGRLLAAGGRSDLYSALATNVLSHATVEQSVQYLVRIGVDISTAVEQIKLINSGESGFSFCKENCGLIAMRMAEHLSAAEVDQHYSDMYFPSDGLNGRSLRSIIFEECHFQPTIVQNSKLDKVLFRNCEFERLDIDATWLSFLTCSFVGCRIDSVLLVSEEELLFDPARITLSLRLSGATVLDDLSSDGDLPFEDDDRLKLLNRFIRIFLRTTQVNEDVIRLRLGSAIAPKFFDEVLPNLLSRGVLSEVTWDGRGVQKRYRLSVPLEHLHNALEKSNGSFEKFLSTFGRN